MSICAANNLHPPMTLRVNGARISREKYLQQLPEHDIPARAGALSPEAVYLERGVDVEKLPGFSAGLVSVQDEAAQLAARLLSAAPGEHVLDACAAPGGKTAHILESEPGLDSLTAVDINPARVRRIEENLSRLGLAARVFHGDAASPESWWDARISLPGDSWICGNSRK